MCKLHPGATGFEVMKGSGKSVEAWHCERLGEATGEGAAPVSVEAPRIEGVMERRL